MVVEGVRLNQESPKLPELTERQIREKHYYEEYSLLKEVDVDLMPAQGNVDRPNSYWYVSKLVRQFFSAPGMKVLDFGCGPGTTSVQYAKMGYQVYGFDIAAGNIQSAQRLAKKYGVQDQCNLQVGVAEHLDFPDNFFDVIAGIDILHHVDIPKAIAECRRVLRPGGIAVFHEPIVVPFFDSIRNSPVGKQIVSKDSSIQSHITEDERKLTAADLAIIRTIGTYEERRFLLFGRLSRFFSVDHFENIDALMLQLPLVNKFGGRVVMRMQK